MELRQGPLGVHLHRRRRPDHHPADSRRRRQAPARVVVGGPGRRGAPGWPPPAASAGVLVGGRADRRGRLRLRQVRANGVGHQRHRLPRPPAQRRGGRLPRRACRRSADDGHLRRSGERRPRCCWPGFEPEEESPIVFLRLRKAARKHASAGDVDRAVRHPRPDQDGGQADPRPRPAREAAALDDLGRRRPAAPARRGDPGRRTAGQLPRCALGGGRLAASHRCPAGLDPAARRRTRRAWRPVRCPNLLPGGRPVDGPVGARADRRGLERRRAARRTRVATPRAILRGGPRRRRWVRC